MVTSMKMMWGARWLGERRCGWEWMDGDMVVRLLQAKERF